MAKRFFFKLLNNLKLEYLTVRANWTHFNMAIFQRHNSIFELNLLNSLL
jgi:hypothetical protein